MLSTKKEINKMKHLKLFEGFKKKPKVESGPKIFTDDEMSDITKSAEKIFKVFQLKILKYQITDCIEILEEQIEVVNKIIERSINGQISAEQLAKFKISINSLTYTIENLCKKETIRNQYILSSIDELKRLTD